MIAVARCPQPSPASSALPPPASVRATTGSATVEFVGSLPVLALGAVLCVQALLVALSLLFAQVVAERSAAGADRPAAVSSLPEPWRRHVHISSSVEQVSVTVRTPALVPGVGQRLWVTARTEPA